MPVFKGNSYLKKHLEKSETMDINKIKNLKYKDAAYEIHRMITDMKID